MATKHRSIVRAILSTPWAIMPMKLDAICEFLEARSEGEIFSQEEIRARVESAKLEMRGNRLEVQNPQQQAIGLIPVVGVLSNRQNMMMNYSGGTSTQAIMSMIDQAENDPNVSHIVFDIDSPGGSAFGVQEVADRIRASEKPTVAVANAQAASGAYWIMSAADEAVVSPSGWVGSIGVLMTYYEDSPKSDETNGKKTFVAAGRYKAEGRGEPLDEGTKKHMQQLVDERYTQFVNAVAEGRGVSAESVRNGFGEGRMVNADEAVSLGMVDRVATIEEVIGGLIQQSASGSEAQSFNTGAALDLEILSMDPKIIEAMVRLNLCAIDASKEVAMSALTGFFVGKRKTVPESNEEILAALNEGQSTVATTTAPAPVSTVPTNVPVVADPVGPARVTTEEILAAVRISQIPAEAQMEAIGTLSAENLTQPALYQRITEIAETANPVAGNKPTSVNVVSEGRDRFIVDARDAILQRVFVGRAPDQIWSQAEQGYVDWKPSVGANHRLGSLSFLAESVLEQCGIPREQIYGLSKADIAMIVMGANPAHRGLSMASDGPAYNVSGMFSNILYDASNVVLRRSYSEVNVTFDQWMKQAESLTDFKAVHKVIAGEIGDPKAIPEDGEFEETTISDAKESYKLTVWGSVWSITWQAVVNDSLSAFTEIQTKLGRSMRRKQNRLAYGVLKDNAAMADTGALFNTTAVTTAGGHANRESGAVTDYSAEFTIMERKMREQRGLNLDSDGSATLNIAPRFIIFPPALRQAIQEVLVSQSRPSASQSGVANIYRDAYQPIVEPEIGTAGGGSNTRFILAADSGDVDTIEYAYLQGLETPAFDQEQAFDRLALRQRMYQAFAVKPLDYRGLQDHLGV